MSDDFTGTSIDNTKWEVYNDVDGGSLTQNDKIFWNKAGSGTWTGHGLRTIQSFENGGKYVIEGDYEITDILKSEGEAGTGINFTRVNVGNRDTGAYGAPLNSITITFYGSIYYRANTTSSGANLTTKNIIPSTQKSSGPHNDIFYYLDDTSVHLKIELDTDNKTIKCWANYQPTTFCEGAFTDGIWEDILNGTNQFKIEEYRAWSGIHNYAEHRLDNYSIRREQGITGTVTDIDGNVYQTAKIGNQWWMAENLKVSHFQNVETIPDVIDNTIYGKLYNWPVVTDSRGIAPEGWHVPTDEDWQELEMYLGMSQSEVNAMDWRGTTEGGKLKEVGTLHWKSPNTGATNETGFTALPGGHNSLAKTEFAYFWSTTSINSELAWNRILGYNSSQISRDDSKKINKFSVRCIKDLNEDSTTLKLISYNLEPNFNSGFQTQTEYLDFILEIENIGELNENVKIRNYINNNLVNEHVIDSIAAGSRLYKTGTYKLNSRINKDIKLKSELLNSSGVPISTIEQKISIIFAFDRNNEPFSLTRDSYSFPNFAPSKEGLLEWLSEYGDIDTDFLIAFLLYDWRNIDGLCFGMSASSSVYFQSENSKPTPIQDTHLYGKSDSNLRKYLYRYQTSQDYLYNGLQEPQSVDDFYNHVKIFLSDSNRVPIVALPGGEKLGGHAIALYKLIDVEGKRAYGCCYDPDYPDTVKTLYIDYSNSSGGIPLYYPLWTDMRVALPKYADSTYDIVQWILRKIKESFYRLFDADFLQVLHKSPVRMLVTDNYNRNIGYINGTTFVNEIPGALIESFPVAKLDSGFVFTLPNSLTYAITYFELVMELWIRLF